MKIALVSLDQVWQNKAANRQRCAYYVQLAAARQVDLVVFPEMTLTGFTMNTSLIAEDSSDSPSLQFFSELAAGSKVALAAGVVLRSSDKATNNLIIVDKQGSLLANYAKIHPFSFSGEDTKYNAGDRLVECVLDGVTIGLTICYDLRFPELYQALSVRSQLILNIANWPERRVNHWNILLQARAIENQCFIAGVNRVGIDGNNHPYVHSSRCIDPLGVPLQAAWAHNEMEVFELNTDEVEPLRAAFPVKKDRKPDFYKQIL